MRLYYQLFNLKDVKEVLVHDLILTNDDNCEIILSGIEVEGNDECGRWKGIEIDGVETEDTVVEDTVVAMIKDALKSGYKLTNCMITGDWNDHAEITLKTEIVIKNSDGSIKERINLTPEPVTIEFDD